MHSRSPVRADESLKIMMMMVMVMKLQLFGPTTFARRFAIIVVSNFKMLDHFPNGRFNIRMLKTIRDENKAHTEYE